MERYLRFLLRVGKRSLLWKKTTNVPACPTAAEWEEHLAATKCARCEKAFVEGCPRSGKVLHAPPTPGPGEYIETLGGSCISTERVSAAGLLNPSCAQLTPARHIDKESSSCSASQSELRESRKLLLLHVCLVQRLLVLLRTLRYTQTV